MGEVAVLIQHVGLSADGDEGAEGGEEVAGEEDEDPHQGAGDVLEDGGEVIAEEQVAHLAHIGQREEGGRHGGDPHGDADDGAGDDADEDGALDLVGGEDAHDGHGDDGQQHGGLLEVAQSQAAALKDGQAGVGEAQVGDEEAHRRGDGDLQVLGQQVHHHLAHAQYSDQDEQDARAQQQRHGPAKGEGPAVDQTAQDEVAAHGGGQSQGQVGVQAHEQGDDAADQGAHDEQGGLADDHAVDVGDVGLRSEAADGGGLDGQDVGHGHEGGDAGQDLTPDGGAAVFQEKKVFFHALAPSS